jgi:hypothetical protein
MPRNCESCENLDHLSLDTRCSHGYCLHNDCGIRGIVCLECIVFTDQESDIDAKYELNDVVNYSGELYTFKDCVYLFAYKLRIKEIYGTNETQIVKMIKELYSRIPYQENTRDKIRDIFINGYKQNSEY